MSTFKKTHEPDLIKVLLEEYLSSLNLDETLKEHLLTDIISRCMKDPTSVLIVKKNGEPLGFAYVEYSGLDSHLFGFDIGNVKAIAFKKLASNVMCKSRLNLMSVVISLSLKKKVSSVLFAE